MPGTSEAYVREKELLLDEKDDQILRLKNALKLVANDYDYCPQIGLVNINGLMVSDVIYTPLTSDEDSIVGLSKVGTAIAVGLFNKASLDMAQANKKLTTKQIPIDDIIPNTKNEYYNYTLHACFQTVSASNIFYYSLTF